MNRKLMLLLSFLFISFWGYTQSDSRVPMADTLRANGKIYVVVAVILTIFAGIIFYLVRLDRKISRLEKSSNHI